jgi:2-polyprenyl-6-methoxyphenol hydroxylase-like FAD-dependent oxidoreductase
VEQPDVLIVGAGPAGLVTGITLARYGVNVLLVEKRVAISTLSRATVIGTRSMEIFRSWGLEDALRAGAADVEPCGWVTPTLASGEGAVIELGYPTAAQAVAISPTRPAWTPQDHLEPLLVGLLQETEHGEIRFACSLVGLEETPDRVVATLRDTASGLSERVRARYLIAADGAHSTVRRQIGIRMEGPEALAEFQMAQFDAPLAEAQGDHRYGLNIITDADAPGVLLARGAGDRWGFAREWRPGQERLDECSEQRLLELITTAAGVAGLRPRIERVSTFRFAAQLAERYRNGRCFLIGDAAHRMTPRGGTGMNTAIQDGYDIGWKLGWVLRGWCGPELLDTYEAERRPVAAHNVARSADPNGAENGAADALGWDLNGRLQHHWIDRNGKTMSTLDLLTDGLTLLGSQQQSAHAAPSDLGTSAPIAARLLDDAVARPLGLRPGDALLVCPDGRPWLSRDDREPRVVARIE